MVFIPDEGQYFAAWMRQNSLLRLVPGYFVAGYNGANPIAVYHGPLDEFGIRNGGGGFELGGVFHPVGRHHRCER